MPQKRSKKIFLYFFLFLLIGSLNNKNLKNIGFLEINEILVTGLDNESNLKLRDKLNFLKLNNLFFLDTYNLKKILNSNSLIENYSVFKEYPSRLNIKINKTMILAKIKKENKIFFLGSNGKFIDTKNIKKNVPSIFGDFETKNFFNLTKALHEANFDYRKIKNLYFFKSKRWDIETKDGLLIKLPQKDLEYSLNLLKVFLDKNQDSNIIQVDLRQNNQIIVNER